MGNKQQILQSFFESELFHDVQTSGIFNDSKTFADAEPIISFEAAMSCYKTEKEQQTLVLSDFLAKHFKLPEFREIKAQEHADDLITQIDYLWSILRKPADDQQLGSLIPLDQPYTVPGGRFREVYYWDSYFAALGLIEANRVNDVVALVENFISIQNRVGCIPNGNRWYYATRSQPPVLAMLVKLLSEHANLTPAQLANYIQAVETEYLFWMDGSEKLEAGESHRRVVRMDDGSLMNRYYDDSSTPRPESYAEDVELASDLAEQDKASFYRNIRAACESGWDFSSRWFSDSTNLHSIATTEIIPVDLNALLYFVESWLAESFVNSNAEKSKAYFQAAKARKGAINSYLWNEKEKFYTDYWFKLKKQSQVKTLAATWPLYFELATKSQAIDIVELLTTYFLYKGGLVTTLNETEQQWDSPNGWAPLHWITVQGLRNYQYNGLADKIAQFWLSTVEKNYSETGKLMEKYNVVQPNMKADGGEYDVQEGFGWTNGVTAALQAEVKKIQEV